MVRLGSVPIDSCSGLGAEIAVPGVEIECTDSVFATDTLEKYSTFDAIGGVVSHSLIVVLSSEQGRTIGGLSKVISEDSMSAIEAITLKTQLSCAGFPSGFVWNLE